MGEAHALVDTTFPERIDVTSPFNVLGGDEHVSGTSGGVHRIAHHRMAGTRAPTDLWWSFLQRGWSQGW